MMMKGGILSKESASSQPKSKLSTDYGMMLWKSKGTL